MNLQDILLLGNDMIIPRDIRDWGVYMGSEPQVHTLEKFVDSMQRSHRTRL